jgi:hypothetical protein
MAGQNPTFTARGNIVPATFVKLDTATNFGVLAAGAGDQIVGIASEAGREPPLPSVSTVYAAQNGEECHVRGQGEVCLLTIGGSVSPKDRLKSDASGFGVATTTNGDEYGAIALESGASGQQIMVQVVTGRY